MPVLTYFADGTDELVLNIRLRELLLGDASKMVHPVTGVAGDDISATVTLKTVPVVTVLVHILHTNTSYISARWQMMSTQAVLQ